MLAMAVLCGATVAARSETQFGMLRRSKGLGGRATCRFPPPTTNDPDVAVSSSAPSHLKFLGLDGHSGDDAPWVSLGSLGPQRNSSGWYFNTSLLELQKKNGVAMMVDMQGITIPQCRGNATCWRDLFIGPNATIGGLWNSSLEAAVQQGLFMGINIGDELLGCGAQVSALEEIFRLCKAVWPEGTYGYR